MAYLKVLIRGTLPGSEVWSCGLAFVSDGLSNAPISQVDMNDLATALAALDCGNALKTMMSSGAAIISVRVEQRTSAGYLLAVGEGARATPLVGLGGASKPAQCAMVFSLRTTVPGRSGRGRIYWPAIGASITPASLRIPMSAVEDALNGFKTYINGMRGAINTALGAGVAVLAVRSERQLTEHWVSVLEAGDIIDTQRRRRDKLVENRVGVPAV